MNPNDDEESDVKDVEVGELYAIFGDCVRRNSNDFEDDKN